MSFLGRWAGVAIGIVGTIVLARLLPPAEFGLFGVAVGVVSVITALRHFGVAEYLIQLSEFDRREIGRAFALTLGLALTFSAVIWLSRDPIARFYGEPRLNELLSLLTVTVLISPFGIGASASLRRDYAFGKLLAIGLMGSLAGLGTSITLAALTGSASSLAWGQIVTVVAHTIGYTIAAPRAVFCPPVLTDLGRLFHFGVFRAATTILFNASNYAIPLLLGRSIGLTAVGLYDRATGLQQRVSADLAAPAMGVVFVALAQAKTDPAKLTELILRSVTNLTGFIWPALALLATLSSPTVLLLYGEVWLPAAPLLTILCVVGAMQVLAGLPFELLTAQGRTLRQLAIECFNIAVLLALTIWLGRYGLTAVAWGGVAASIVQVAVRWSFCLPGLSLRPMALVAVIGRSLLLSLGTAAPAALLLFVGVGDRLRIIEMLLLGGISGMLGWLGTARLLRHPSYDEVMHWVKRAWLKRSS
jgi:O-antigen/teichoic acid export membrane protein